VDVHEDAHNGINPKHPAAKLKEKRVIQL